MKVIDPFSNVADQPIEGSIYGSQISNFNSLEIGAGSKTMKVDESGLWLGADQFADAPFRVDMSGNIYASSVTLTQYVLAVGGSYTSASSGARVVILPDANNGIVAYASNGTSVVFQVVVGGASVGDVVIGNYAGGYGALWDQSAGVLYIKGDIIAGNIDADRISTGTLGTSRIPNLSASKITSGTIDADRIGADTITASKIDVTTLASITADLGTITAGTINATNVSVTNLSASNIVSGNYSVGGTGAPSYIQIKRDDSSGSNAYLRFEGGSKMWSDSSNRIGINSLGSPMYIYVDSTEKIVIPTSGQVTIRGGVYADGNLNVIGDARINDGNKLKLYSNSTQYIDSDSDDQRYFSYDNHEFYQNGSIKAIIDGNIWTDGDLTANGSKPFIIPHPDGSNRYLRYTAQESPDVSLRYRGFVKDKGRIKLPIPQHFILITEPKGLVTVNLTATAKNQMLYLDSIKDNHTIYVETDAPFLFEIVAIRKGYLDYPVELDKNDSKVSEKDKLMMHKMDVVHKGIKKIKLKRLEEKSK